MSETGLNLDRERRPVALPMPDPLAGASKLALSEIPTQDPEAALRFCRALARLLAEEPAASAAVARSGLASPPVLSVVVPISNEQENLPALYERLTAVLERTGLDYELVCVDDGSRDRSAELLRGLAARDRRITLVELARNFGHQVAISAGLEHARGRAVAVMDADLQDPPEVLPEFIARWQEGHDVVYGVRQDRKESWSKRAAYATFYRLLRNVANIEIPLDAGDFCIMDRKVVDLLVSMPERNRFVRGIRSWIGFHQVGLPYERHARLSGRTTYTFPRLVHLALDGLVSFSYVPLRAITLLGFTVSLASILLAIFYAVKKLVVGLTPPGFATTIVAIFFLAGAQLITIGLIGEYVGRIFEEVKHRPLYVARRVIRSRDRASGDAQQ